jgi:hypothetical protein
MGSMYGVETYGKSKKMAAASVFILGTTDKNNKWAPNLGPFFILYTLLLKGRVSVAVYLSRFLRLLVVS